MRRRVSRLWNEGYLLDVRVLEQCVMDNGGDITFEEAFRRTGRVLNITVVPGGMGETPPVLNYITAPDVVSARCAPVPFPASCQPSPPPLQLTTAC